MFNIEFSMYGTAAMAILIIISIISIWVVGANIKYKNQDTRTSIITNSIKFSKVSAEQFGEKVKFNVFRNHNWWSSEVSVKKKTVWANQDAFNSTSIFYQINTMFYTMLYIELNKAKKSYKAFTLTFKFIIAISALNILWMLALGFWIGVIIFTSILFISMIIEIIYMQKEINMATKLTGEFLTQGVSELESTMIKKYLKYKKIIIFTKYIGVFFEPLLGIGIMFRNWGRDE